MNQSNYIGRFAPSPSGPLHLGSLVTALGSFLQAKRYNGKWLLRIDDIDPPRIMPGAIEDIQQTLKIHGLNWDDEIIFQSHNSDDYKQLLTTLQHKNLLYPCECTRAQIKSKGDFYQGTCREKANVELPYSLRIKNQFQILHIQDVRLGEIAVNGNATKEDFIVRRKDGLFAYHLASVADDLKYGITEIVRGEDLINATACQWAMFKTLDRDQPACLHLPLVTFPDGRKFSKQNHAPNLDLNQAKQNIIDALAYLDLHVPVKIRIKSISVILDWAIQAWTESFCE